MRKRRLLALLALPAALVAFALSVGKTSRTTPAEPKLSVPTTQVRRGDVVFTVTARGALQGGRSENIAVPMTGGGNLAITFLRQNGENVEPGDVVVAFDTTEQEYKLREAEADLAEAEQRVIEAKASNQARDEEANSQLVQARTDARVAELECRRNELFSRMTARQNELALAAARERVEQLERDITGRKQIAAAGIALQEAARAKASVQAKMAQRNIDVMTVKAKTAGYVALQQNQDGMFRWGMQLPVFQVGDMVRPGVSVAQIPDLESWEASAKIGELDRGHLAEGQPATIEVAALPGRTFQGKVKIIGGTTGPPWDRSFDCRVSLDDAMPELRPGMSTIIRITTGRVANALWIPAQAVFESSGRSFVYLRSGAGFVAQDVKLARRSEDKVVIEGLSQGQQVALASPDQTAPAQKGAVKGAPQAPPKS